jgi:hypothetical protein
LAFGKNRWLGKTAGKPGGYLCGLKIKDLKANERRERILGAAGIAKQTILS